MFFSTIMKIYGDWRRYNAGLSALSSLSDRELADMGISRADIYRVAWEKAREAAWVRQARPRTSGVLISESWLGVTAVTVASPQDPRRACVWAAVGRRRAAKSHGRTGDTPLRARRMFRDRFGCGCRTG
jgi:uncharacterized protein YjiS (DUF1127 family)